MRIDHTTHDHPNTPAARRACRAAYAAMTDTTRAAAHAADGIAARDAATRDHMIRATAQARFDAADRAGTFDN